MSALKELMRLRDIKQKEIAAEIGVTQPTVSDWVNGKKIPEGKNLQKLAKLLDVDPAVILGHSETKPEDEDEDIWAFRERVRRDPDYQLLFRAANKATPEHIRAATAVLKSLEPNDD